MLKIKLGIKPNTKFNVIKLFFVKFEKFSKNEF